MKRFTKIEHYLAQHPTLKQWLWFALLWCGGLVAVLLIALPIKLLILWAK